jgi:hypothetical protein
LGSVSICWLAVVIHPAYACICCSAASESRAHGIGSTYNNLVFISIRPMGPNLPLGSKLLDTSNTLDHNILSDDFSETNVPTPMVGSLSMKDA